MFSSRRLKPSSMLGGGRGGGISLHSGGSSRIDATRNIKSKAGASCNQRHESTMLWITTSARGSRFFWIKILNLVQSKKKKKKKINV